MNEEEFDDKFYSQIIYKTKNEPEIHEIVNKKNRSRSPKLLPKWSPEISYEQRIRKKKQREDVYVQKIYPEERPILLVKKKQVYKNLGNPVLIGRAPDEDPAFKLTSNTEKLEDLDRDILHNEKNIRRFTMIRDKGKGNETNPQNKSVYKFQGVEYLPEGFLELDPLHYKNEFYFDSKFTEKVFTEEQRRLKVLRRKQYADKNYLKKRDVTIYVIDQYKDKVVDFLDLWFEKYERKMNRAELNEVASRLGTSYQNMQHLQELYLQKKSLLQSTQMKEYFNRIQKNFIPVPNGTRMPSAVKRYLKDMGKFNMTKSKVRQDPLGNSRWKYLPRYLDKYHTTQNISGRPYSATFKSTGGLPKRSRSPYRNRLGKTTPSKNYKFGKTYDPKFTDTSGLRVKTKKTKKGFKKKGSDGNKSNTDTFFLLSKTNINDRVLSPTSKGGSNGKERMDKLMDEFSELIGKKEAEPIARFHRKNEGFSKTYGNILDDNINLKIVDGDINEEYGLDLKPGRSNTEKKVPNFGDFDMRKSEGQNPYDKKLIEDRLKGIQTKSGLPDMSTNETQVKGINKPAESINENEDTALKNYFDTEINHLLHKIKGIKTEKDSNPYREKLNSGDENLNEIEEMSEIGVLKEEMMSGKASNDDLRNPSEELSVVDYDDSNSNNKSFFDEERKNLTFPNLEQDSVPLLENETIPERLDLLHEFSKKKPNGEIKLTNQQRDKLIEILDSLVNEDEDIILTVNKEQTRDLIQKNLSKQNPIVNVRKEAVEGDLLRLYPKDFYPLVERSSLTNCNIMAYPKKMFELVDRRPLMLRKPLSENGNVGVKPYDKNVLQVLDQGFEDEEISGYPQDLFDLLQLLGKYPNEIELQKKAEEYFPEELSEIIKEQIERENNLENLLLPEEIFELGDQEKLTGERLSFWANDIFKLLNRESHNNEKVLFSNELAKKIQSKFKNLLVIDEEQQKNIVDILTREGNSQVVISPDQKNDLLNLLKTNRELQLNGKGRDCVVQLSADQIMDIINQKCLVKGIPINLNEEQKERVDGKSLKIIKKLEGADYYDPIQDKLVDYKGDCIWLCDLDPEERKSLLKKLEGKKFQVAFFEPKLDPKVVEECYFDPIHDSVVDTRKAERINLKILPFSKRKEEIKKLYEKNMKPLLNVMPGESYYDAVTDEIMDQKGERHALKDMTLNEVEDLVTENEAEAVPVVIQFGENQANCLDGVKYLPIEDCLIDHKNRKTILTDLNENERLSLMDALGQRKGVPLIKREEQVSKKSPSKARSPKYKMKELDEVMDRLEGNSPQSKSWKKNYSGRASREYPSRLTSNLTNSIETDSKPISKKSKKKPKSSKQNSKKSKKKPKSSKSTKKKSIKNEISEKDELENDFMASGEMENGEIFENDLPIDKRRLSEMGHQDMGTFVDDGSMMDGTFEIGRPKEENDDENVTNDNLLKDVMEKDEQNETDPEKNEDEDEDENENEDEDENENEDENEDDEIIESKGKETDQRTDSRLDDNLKDHLISKEGNFGDYETFNAGSGSKNKSDLASKNFENIEEMNENNHLDEKDETIQNEYFIEEESENKEISSKNNNEGKAEFVPSEDLEGYSNSSELSKRVTISKSGKVVGIMDENLKSKIERIFFEEKQKLSKEIIEKCEKMIKNRNGNNQFSEGQRLNEGEEGMMEEFFKFCQDKLPSDPIYKESMMFVSLFYYFLDKKGMLKESPKRMF